MSQDIHISKRKLVYTMPGVDAVRIRRDEPYQATDEGPLTIDLYYPPDSKSGARSPAVVFVTGYSDIGVIDFEGSSRVADAARQFGFVNPCGGQSVEDLPREKPLFIARAGQDQMPGLNDALDRFLGKALSGNLPVTFVNHAQAPHAFDVFQDSAASHEVIRQVLTFLQFHLLT